MKTFLLATLLFALPVTVFCQNKAANKFYRQYKNEKEVKSFRLPGWLINLGGKIGGTFAEEEEAQIALPLLKHIKKTRFMMSEEGGGPPTKAINELVKDLKNFDYEDMIIVREGNTNVNIMAKMDGDVIKNMLILVKDEGDFVYLSMKAKLPVKELGKIIKQLLENEFGENDNWELEPKKVEEKPKKKPMA